MFISSRINRTHRLYVPAALAGAMLLFAGCATAPMAPPASLNEARIAIQAAEKDDANQYAGAELDEARQKFMMAENAVTAENMLLAERFADESTIMAQLATAKTEATKAETINEEMRRSSKALREEMRRVGDQQ